MQLLFPQKKMSTINSGIEKRKRVRNEYKAIKDNYSWDDEFEFEGGPAISTHSPKIYDLRTPQKKSRKTDTYSDDTSENWFDLSKDL